MPSVAEVDAAAGHEVHMGQHVGDLRVAPLRAWPSTACSLVVPAGNRLPTTPAKMTSVARPRTHGPMTERVTLSTPSPRTAATSGRSGRSIPSSRRLEPLKSIVFAGGIPPIIIRPGPNPPGGCGRLVVAGGTHAVTPSLRSIRYRTSLRSVTRQPPAR